MSAPAYAVSGDVSARLVRALRRPYVMEQDGDGVWCVHALPPPGIGAFGNGSTPEEVITDLSGSLEGLLEVAEPPSELTLAVNTAEHPAASRLAHGEGVSVNRRVDFYDDPGAPAANSLVPSVNLIVVNDGEVRQEFSLVLTARILSGRPTPSSESSEVRWSRYQKPSVTRWTGRCASASTTS